MRTPRVQGFHIHALKRLAKSYSGQRVIGFLWSLSVLSVWKAAFQFSSVEVKNGNQTEGWNRLQTIHSKNKLGFHTRWMSDFDLFLESMLNEKFLEQSSDYYDDPVVSTEIMDLELGLNSDMSESDVRHMQRDKDPGHGPDFKCTRWPGRVGTNYAKGDALSCYKVLPKGQMPHV